MAMIENSVKGSETATISSICALLCLVVTLLGIKFRWFRHRLTFNEALPTAPDRNSSNNSVVSTSGIYRPNADFDSFVDIRPPKELPPVRVTSTRDRTSKRNLPPLKIRNSQPNNDANLPSPHVLNSESPHVLNSESPRVLNSESPSVLNSESPRVLNSGSPRGFNSESPRMVNAHQPLRRTPISDVQMEHIRTPSPRSRVPPLTLEDFVDILPELQTPPATAVRRQYFTDEAINERIIPASKNNVNRTRIIPSPPEYTPPPPRKLELPVSPNLNKSEIIPTPALRHKPVSSENLTPTTETSTKSGFFGFKSKTTKSDEKEVKQLPKEQVVKFIRIKKEKENKNDKLKKGEKVKTKATKEEISNFEKVKASRRMTGFNYSEPEKRISEQPISIEPFNYDDPIEITSTSPSQEKNSKKQFLKLEGFDEEKPKEKFKQGPKAQTFSPKPSRYDNNKDDDEEDDVWNMVARHRRSVTAIHTDNQLIQQNIRNPQMATSTGGIMKNNTSISLDKPKTLREMQREQKKVEFSNENQEINQKVGGGVRNGFAILCNNSESDTEA